MTESAKLKEANTTESLSDKGYEILRYAVNIVRNEQIRRLHALRARLLKDFPGEDDNVRAALRYWALREHAVHTR